MSLEMDHLERLDRHTVSIEKSISRTLHEIERLQARRSGIPVLPPVSLDVNLHSEGPNESHISNTRCPGNSTIERESNLGVTSGATEADISHGDGELSESPASEETSKPESVSSESLRNEPNYLSRKPIVRRSREHTRVPVGVAGEPESRRRRMLTTLHRLMTRRTQRSLPSKTNYPAPRLQRRRLETPSYARSDSSSCKAASHGEKSQSAEMLIWPGATARQR